MGADEDLERIRGRVFAAYFEDGLFELTLGLSLVLWGCLFLADLAYMMWLPWILFASSLPAAKKRYVAARVGYVALPSRKEKIRLGAVILFTLLALLGVVVLILTARQRLPGWLESFLTAMFEFGRFSAVVGVVLAGVFGFLGLRSGMSRYYAFAVLFGVGGVVASFLKVEVPIRFALLLIGAGGLVTVSGLAVFLRFLNNNPLPKEGATSDDG